MINYVDIVMIQGKKTKAYNMLKYRVCPKKNHKDEDQESGHKLESPKWNIKMV